MTAVHLSGLSRRHGHWHDLDRLTDDGAVSAASVAALRRGGLTRYAVFEEPPSTLYADCLAETLDRTGLPAADVDAVLFFSSTFSAYDDHADLAALCARFGIRDAFPLGMFLGQCTNFSSALTVAQGLAATQGLDNVLLLGVDALDDGRAARVLPGDVSVFSDTLVTCLLSRQRTDGHLVERVEHCYRPELHALHPQRDLLRYIDGFTGALGDVVGRLTKSTGRAPEAYAKLVLAHHARPVLRNFAATLGIPFDRVPTEGIGTLGHCFAYDQLITLSELAERGETSDGDALLAIGVGANYLYSATSFIRCEA
ncbi:MULTISPECIES: 3-oxoacyl-[acyl-carrier-protein] synthase III C-terminal domain-containing protein [Streptomyces]|uniref:3-oxoacyl-[acyl-carrier-protein] synthase III C-terminal domain-containing protein n=1 Tax=Streptomyces TaxID=1883 RepID=UPI001C8CC20A|nr:3-oxoacyl-[acyl-carrier-protein] synthase III C-terminal domain-containing protein [Streptomyces lateritius]MBX9422363.1 3-oxoacyl-ACP synthase [Streptomyces lateritius]